MALKDIPVLSSDHPLYDWSDYQSSRDALVSGTPTRHFAKEAWNAIVDSLNDALTAAGLAWDPVHTTAEGAKITEPNGKLTAAKFNSIRSNIDGPAPLGWAWADRENFRGYVGRENFYGRASHGRRSDSVYPEYIIELVRKLNLLIEIMRGTAMIEEVEAQQISALTFDIDIPVRPSAPIEASCNARSIHKAEVDSRPSAPMEASQLSSSLVSAEVRTGKAVEVSAYVRIPYMVRAEGRSKPSIPVTPEPQLMHSAVSAEAFAVDPDKLVPVSASYNAAVLAQAAGGAGRILPIEPGALVVKSRGRAEVDKGEPMPISGRVISFSSVSAGVELAEHLVPMSCLHRSKTRVSCEFDTAWLPPVWVNGGLWIRQAHTINQREDGSLEVL